MFVPEVDACDPAAADDAVAGSRNQTPSAQPSMKGDYPDSGGAAAVVAAEGDGCCKGAGAETVEEEAADGDGCSQESSVQVDVAERSSVS